jgi:hypothetical protein
MRRPLAALAALTLIGCVPPTRRTILGDGDGSGDDQTAPRARAGDAAPVIPGFEASRFIPAHPTYALTARNLADAQRAIKDLLGTLGAAVQLDPATISQSMELEYGVDALSSDALGLIGIDTAAGASLFSEDIDPTLVVHLASPVKMRVFLEVPRARATTTHAGDTDIFTIPTRAGSLSWAVDGDWLWVHLNTPIAPASGSPGAAPAPDSPTAWFEHGRAGGGANLPTWQRTLHHDGVAGMLAYADLHALGSALLAHAPGNVGQCAQKLTTIGGLDGGGLHPAGSPAEGRGGSIDGSVDFDTRHLGLRLALDLGAAAPGLSQMIVPPPAGWQGAATGAPLAVQWNVDVPTASAALAPCLPEGAGADLAQLQSYGVRAARLAMLSFTDETTFSGAVSLDLTSSKYISDRLDEIPFRKHLESDRMYGPYPGHHLAIPTMFAIDYVLTPQLAMLARGDGLLDRMASPPAAPARSPLFAIDVQPAAMSPGQWKAFTKLVGAPDAVMHIVDWRAIHVGASVDGSEVVIEASAERR